MKLARLLPLVGLFLLAGCWEKPEEHMLEALQKQAARVNLFPNDINLHTTSCDGGSDMGGKTYYNCAVSFTETDITGAPQRMNMNVVLVKDASDWYLARY